MFLKCPYCGERDVGEFVCKGQALPQRPDPSSPNAGTLFHDYYYSRANPAGPLWENWFHEAGCANWLTVCRDSRTHEVLQTAFTQDVTS
jgi:methylglutamate dehydrogenase subunit B